MARAVITDAKYTLELNQAEAQALDTLLAHVAKSEVCYGIADALQKVGIEYDETQLRFIAEDGTEFQGFDSIRFPD